jgi:SAM-dependent methyltransferase
MKISDHLAPLKSLALTFLCQLIGAVYSTGLGSTGVPLIFLFVIHSLISGYLSIFLKLSTPWRFINFMIPAGLLVSSAFPGYGWIWLVLLIVFGLIFLPTFWTRVPYYPSSQKVYSLIAEQLPGDKTFRFVDLGCGDGKLLNYLAKQFPLGIFEGLELSPTAIVAAKTNTRKNKNVKIKFGDYWKESLASYDYVYAFLSPTPMAQLQKKISKELSKGSVVLVNTFPLPDSKASKEIEINDRNQTSLYIYNI